jgi:hypothetical protein
VKRPELPREPGLELQIRAPGERFEGREVEKCGEELGLARRDIAFDEGLDPSFWDNTKCLAWARPAVNT